MIAAFSLIVRKDLRVLARSRGLLLGLVLYPLLLAVLIALVAREAGGRPRIAYVDEAHLPAILKVGTSTVDYGALLRGVAEHVEVVPMSVRDANDALADGSVLAIVRVPAGFVDDLASTIRSPAVDVTVRGGLGGQRAVREIESLAYQLNTGVQKQLLAQALKFLRLVVTGGSIHVGTTRLDMLGLAPAALTVDDLARRATSPADRAALLRVRDFATAARLALAFADPSLKVVAQPVTIAEHHRGTDDLLGTRGIGVVLAVGIVLASVLLGAGALAAEREEQTLTRLLRGRVTLTTVVAAKVAHVAIVGSALGLGVTLLYQLVAVLTGAPAPGIGRIALALPVFAVSAAASGAVGALIATLARDLAGSALVSALVALPFVLVGLAPRLGGSVAIVTGSFPFSPSVDGIAGVLYDPSPAGPLVMAIVHLGLLTLAGAGVARALSRRLV